MPQSQAAVAEKSPEKKILISERSHRWIGVGILVIAAVVVMVAWLIPRHWPFSRERVTQALEKQFAGKATFTAFRTTYLPHPGCVVWGLVIVPDAQAKDKTPLIIADRLVVMAHYWDVILRPGVVAHLRTEGLRVHIPTGEPFFRKDTAESHTLAEAIANGSLLEIGRQRGDPLRFEIHRLAMKSVGLKQRMSYDVAFQNPIPRGEIESRGTFGPWNSNDPGETPVSGRYKFRDADLGRFEGVEGILESEDSFGGTLTHIATHGTVKVPEFKVRRAGRSVPLESEYEAEVNGFNGDVHLKRTENSIVKTKVLANGDITGKPGEKGKTTTLELHSSGGRIQDLLRLFIKEKASPISGTISFRAHATVPPEDRPFEKDLRLSGDFGIEDQRFTKPETRKEIEHLSERSQGQKPKDDDEKEDPAGVVTNLKGHVEVRDGVATLTSITFTIPGGEANGHGTFNLVTHKIDFHGTLKTDAEFTKVAGGGMKSIFLKPFDAIFKRKPKGSEIPVKLTGTYEDPQAGLEITGGKKEKKSGE